MSGHGRVVAGESPCPPEALALGMSTALTGPAADLGINMRDGVLAALDEANRGQGIKGRQLCLAALDDGYEPAQTVPNMLTLINAQQVLALIGNVGTPTAVAALPIALRANTPFYGAFTGAGILRKSPPDRYVINYRASYGEETAAMVDALIEHGGLRPEEIAFFTQRDAFGDAGFVGGLTALKQHGLRQENKIAHGRYERNTLAVENGLADIMLAETVPRAVIMVGTYAPCAEFIQLAKKYGLDALFLNVSFVGAAPLAKGLGDQGDGVIITQVVPHFEADLPIVRDFRKALETWNQDITPSFGALEGYIATRILLLALHRIDDAITRESIIDALEGLGEFDVGLQAPLLLSKEEHQASHQVWPTVIRQGKVVPFAWQNLKGRR
ncbi:MAG: ligand-binding receptor [Deltaproteobacteria bacterium RIFOXYD12_FULL_57_12]|nr:MAG: ligand-binding receptor [Deltaproteobacteria bacterium RIFOXYD12_FULL_57_12]